MDKYLAPLDKKIEKLEDLVCCLRADVANCCGGSGGSGWSLTGDAGTTVGTNFIGTTDNKGLMFKTNNIQSGYLNIIGHNVSFGLSTLINNTTGIYNTAVGESASCFNTTGNGNTSFGASALYNVTTGNYNTGVGLSALPQLISGSYNTSLGNGSGTNISSGTYNTIIGNGSGGGITTGSYNTIIGIVTGLTSSLNNTVILADGQNNKRLTIDNTGQYKFHSYGAGTYTGTVAKQLQVDSSGNVIEGDLGWGTAGNAGTTPGTNFIGTTSNVGLMFKVNSTQSGYIDIAQNNTSFGYHALDSSTTATRNTAFGESALTSLTTSAYNNTAIGHEALYTSTQTLENTAVGYRALYKATASVSSFNTAIGSSAALYITGEKNVAVGMGALSGNSFFLSNVTNNIGVGYYALDNIYTGNYNIGVGSLCLHDLTTGSYNISLGSTTSGTGLTTGSYNVLIGNNITGLSSALSNTIIIADGQGNKRLTVDNTGKYKFESYGVGTYTGTATKQLQVDSSGNVIEGNLAWSILGNSGTSAGTNFIGNTDNVPLIFKINNLVSGSIYGNVGGSTGPSSYNTSFGYIALQFATGGYNTAIGTSAAYFLTTGGYNVAIGTSALNANVAGNGNVAIGYQASSLITQDYNISIGYQAGYKGGVNDHDNISIGYKSGNFYTGAYNVLIGAISVVSSQTINNHIIFGDGQGNIRLRYKGDATIPTWNADLPTYATNALALLAGLVTNDFYKTSTGELRIVV